MRVVDIEVNAPSIALQYSIFVPQQCQARDKLREDWILRARVSPYRLPEIFLALCAQLRRGSNTRTWFESQAFGAGGLGFGANGREIFGAVM